MKNLSRNLLIAAAIIVAGFLVYTFRSIVSYVLIAWVLSMIGQPLTRFFQRRLRIGKWTAGPITGAVLTILCFFIVLLSLILIFVPMFIQQAGNLATVDYSAIARTIEEPITHFQEWLSSRGIHLDAKAPEEWLRNMFAKTFDPTRLGAIVTGVLSAASGLIVDISCIVFITFFFLKEQGLFVNVITVLAPAKSESKILESVDIISRLLTRYFAGMLLQMFVITIYVSLLLTILGVRNALLIGFFAALMNVIPYLGPFIGGALGIIITITSNVDLDFYSQLLPLLIKVALVFATVQMLDNYFLSPYIFSSSVLAHPLEIFLVILMGAQISGIAGMILAIPVYTVLRVIAKEFLNQFRVVQALTDKMEEEGY
jgi:predicted PurR-regulated permease PerM